MIGLFCHYIHNILSFVDYETEMIHSPPESLSFVHLSCESGIGHVTTNFSSRVHSTSSTGMVK